jgi:hypothetical protein
VCWLQRISIPCRKYVACSESMFDAEIRLSATKQYSLLKLCCQAKQCSLSKLCCLQRSSVRCRNYVVCSASEFATKIGLCAAKQCSLRNCVVYSESVFIAEIVLSAVSQCSLPKCVVYSESVFTAKTVMSVANQRSLPKWCCLQRASVRCWNYLSAVNQSSLPKLCCVQRARVHYWDCIICSEAVFAVETVLSAGNQCSLLNSGVCSKLAFAAEVCCLQQISVCCRIFIVYRDPVFANKILQQIYVSEMAWWLKWLLCVMVIRETMEHELVLCMLETCVMTSYVWLLNTNVLICGHWCFRWYIRDRTFVRTRTSRWWNR